MISGDEGPPHPLSSVGVLCQSLSHCSHRRPLKGIREHCYVFFVIHERHNQIGVILISDSVRGKEVGNFAIRADVSDWELIFRKTCSSPPPGFNFLIYKRGSLICVGCLYKPPLLEQVPLQD